LRAAEDSFLLYPTFDDTARSTRTTLTPKLSAMLAAITERHINFTILHHYDTFAISSFEGFFILNIWVLVEFFFISHPNNNLFWKENITKLCPGTNSRPKKKCLFTKNFSSDIFVIFILGLYHKKIDGVALFSLLSQRIKILTAPFCLVLVFWREYPRMLSLQSIALRFFFFTNFNYINFFLYMLIFLFGSHCQAFWEDFLFYYRCLKCIFITGLGNSELRRFFISSP